MTNTFKAVILSFYSGHFYGEQARDRKGIGMKLIFALSFLTTLILLLSLWTSGLYSQAHEALAKLPALVETLPAFTVSKEGKLSIDKPVPYRVNFGTSPDDVWIIIDTSYHVSDINALEQYMRQNKVMLLLTEDKIVSRNTRKVRGQQTQLDDSLQISNIKDYQALSITHDNWRTLASVVIRWGMPSFTAFLCFAVFIGASISNFISTLFTAIVVRFLGFISRAGFDYAGAMRLSAAARIPVTVICMLPIFIGHMELHGLTGWLLWSIYLLFAVFAVRLHSPKSVQ